MIATLVRARRVCKSQIILPGAIKTLYFYFGEVSVCMLVFRVKFGSLCRHCFCACHRCCASLSISSIPTRLGDDFQLNESHGPTLVHHFVYPICCSPERAHLF